MNIGIIVYSQTNHTYSVAQMLQDKLSGDGHEVSIQGVGPAGQVKPGEIDVKFDELPDITPYDVLIFGSPVHGFALAPAMNAYLHQISSLDGKKIACYVTKGLPMDRTGGNQAIKQMTEICESKGGTVVGTGIVTWSFSRQKKIDKLLAKFSTLLK